MKSDLLNILHDRGFIYQCTDLESLDNLLLEKESAKFAAYIGFDCTASSLHVGSLLQLMTLSWLEKLGYKSIVLLGGATSLIGDPSGKDKARSVLSEETIRGNFAGIEKCIRKFLPNVTIVDNSDWLSNINYLDFLRDYGSLFSVNQMINYDSVKQRLARHESSLSFLEFNYMILQGYDFVHLAKNYDCRLQLGGSDQWGNIINGIELGRKLGINQLFGLTSPLITMSNGKKMGKTSDGAVWLDENLLSPFNYWQFWRNVDDKDVGRFLKIFTFLTLNEIAKLESLQGHEINYAKKVLANEATKICHGGLVASEVAKKAEEIFEKQNDDAVDIFNSSPINIIDLLISVGFSSSNSDARRAIRNKSVRVDGVILDDELKVFNKSFKLSFGKKKHLLINVN